ncbi:hypothetical protein U3516DRAFT_818457 [Neocallimastix sp. 'constans']|jgi:hypothetical protein
MEPEFHLIPLNSTSHDIEVDMNELMENSLKYRTFNKNEVKYLYNSLIDNCIYFLETSYASLLKSKKTINHRKFRCFIEGVLRKTKITIPILYSVMYYLKRFRTSIRKCPEIVLDLKEGLTITQPKDLKKVFISASILSLKFFNDIVIMNSEWTKFVDITVEQINLCERQFIEFINYNLNLNVKNYYVFINDYLKRLKKSKSITSSTRNSLPPIIITSHPIITTSPPIEESIKCSSIIQQQQPLTINCNKIPNINYPIYNTPTHSHPVQSNTLSIDNNNNNNNGSMSHSNSCSNTSANAFLSITPTPSIGSQVTPTPSLTEKILTPIDTTTLEINDNDNTNDTNKINNNKNNDTVDKQELPNPPRILFSDPVSIGEQTSPERNTQYSSNDTYSSIMKTNTDSTYVAGLSYNQGRMSSTSSQYYPTSSPQFYNNSIYDSESNTNNTTSTTTYNNNMANIKTPKNNLINTFSAMSYSSCSSESTLHSYNSMDDKVNIVQDKSNHHRMPLNKILYHNLHRSKQTNSYSKKRKIDDKGKQKELEQEE